jgi:TP901 family phage tail tape measure protein
MKTIIARFTEMKKATSDIVNIDGEEVSVNKVEDALKSAGVALRDANGEFRDLDDVFLELSSKWDSLDVMTQRYVATMAAGSRQQSRFIAMMQNYDRTMELVEAAYDSSGASATQFAKTQDSLETKITNLQSAWQEFLMGISNSEVIKNIVELLTKLINVLNDATTGVGGFSTFMLRMFTVLTTFKIGKNIFDKMFANINTELFSGG